MTEEHVDDQAPGRQVDIDITRLDDPDYMRNVTRDLFGPRPPEHLRPSPEELCARLRAMNADAEKAAADPTAVHSPNTWAVLRAQLDRAGLTEADVPWLTVIPTASEGEHHDDH